MLKHKHRRSDMTYSSKTAAIRSALLKGDRLTHMKALAYGTHRLAAVIYDLRKQGMVINAVEKRDSNGTRYAEYSCPTVRAA